jgi:methylthioribose-1-phosphate isomerase
MKIAGKLQQTIWRSSDGESVSIIDQTVLPHEVRYVKLSTVDDAARAIKTMQVRGAPLIGVTAAYGLALALRRDPGDQGMGDAIEYLAGQRPTAVNLRWALEDMRRTLSALLPKEREAKAFARAAAIAEEDAENCRRIGVNGLEVIRRIAAGKRPEEPTNVLTHCNAGWLACVDWGTATSPIYHAHDAGIPIHVWVDETRPRNQGASLTAFELGEHGVAHTLVADNAGGHLMQSGKVDLCIVGADRVSAAGDAANKIGTYLKALAAHDTGVPFYVALPYSTIDWLLTDAQTIPIEERSAEEVLVMSGKTADGRIESVRIAPERTGAANPGFDVTPARLISGLITERGVCPATREGLLSLYPERRAGA